MDTHLPSRETYYKIIKFLGPMKIRVNSRVRLIIGEALYPYWSNVRLCNAYLHRLSCFRWARRTTGGCLQ